MCSICGLMLALINSFNNIINSNRHKLNIQYLLFTWCQFDVSQFWYVSLLYRFTSLICWNMSIMLGCKNMYMSHMCWYIIDLSTYVMHAISLLIYLIWYIFWYLSTICWHMPLMCWYISLMYWYMSLICWYVWIMCWHVSLILLICVNHVWYVSNMLMYVIHVSC